jgi:hypothetical protein
MESTHKTSKANKKPKKRKFNKKKRSNSAGDENAPNKYQKAASTHLVTTPSDSEEEEGSSDAEEITRRDTFPGQPIEQFQPSIGNSRSLAPLLMRSGSLNDLLTGQKNTWPALASTMKEIYLPIQKKSNDPTQYYAELFNVYYAHGEKPKVIPGPEGGRLGSGIGDTAEFLKNFMDANGQWSYIENQDWYKKGEFVIGIDVNYYPDRSGLKDVQPAFHKDTGGNNIFVNLIFDNKDPIESTEWFADTEQPSADRSEWQQRLLPAAYLDELDKTRKALKAQSDSTTSVQGGVSDGPNTYVSWVDDLVWHATPTVEKRTPFSVAAAQQEYAQLNSASTAQSFAYQSDKNGTILGVEILGTIAEADGTALHKWLVTNELSAQDINDAVARKAWQDLYSKNKGGEKTFLADAKIRETANPVWLITGQYSEANAYDKRLKDSYSVQETPISLSTRRRANSLDTGEVQQARDANKGVARSFIRTWVRILPRDSAELKKIGGI